MSPLVRQIRLWLDRYLTGHISLEDFDRWLTATTWDVEHANDPEAERIVDEITLRLAEYSRGHWTAEELRKHLGRVQSVQPDMGRATMSDRPVVIRLELRESPWVHQPATESRGEHAIESTMRVGAGPVYQSPRIEVGAQTER